VKRAMSKTKIALVGLGKIARDQHVPVLGASGAFELVAVASPNSRLDGVRSYENLEALLASEPELEAVALCTTPQVRYGLARLALEHGLHVLLEKPPGVTVTEVQALVEIAARKHVALFASWHSRHAAAVESARAWLTERRIKSVSVEWKEDVRVWHPGQTWIWQAGGLGVFDPGINALSILTRILPGRLSLRQAMLSVPSNCETPIAAELSLSSSASVPVRVELDFLQVGPQTWDITAETDAGRLTLSMGGTVMKVEDRVVTTTSQPEYTALYEHFAALVRECRVDVDLSPLQLVADAFLCGRQTRTAAFTDR
jgi:predicted dehydrogenase